MTAQHEMTFREFDSAVRKMATLYTKWRIDESYLQHINFRNRLET